MPIAEELWRLRAENAELKRLLAEALGRIAQLEQQLAELEQKRGEPPSFVKPNRPKAEGPQKPRKKRDPKHNHGRKREPPTRTVEHSLERCPECNCRVHGRSLDYTRQVIELPPPQPVEVIEHQVIRSYCPKCERWRSPKLDLSGQVLGQGRMGVGIASLMAYLRNCLRLTVKGIKEYLEAVHGLRISAGEIVELLHRVRKATQETVKGLQAEMRASPVVYADETGWRQNGQNGYLWSFSTDGEGGVRYYEHDPSRGQKVVGRILAGKFKGCVVSDFYCGYNDYPGEHQRCWVHLLRDLHKLKEEHGQEEEKEVVEWAKEVRALYDEAQEWVKAARGPTKEERERKYGELVRRAHWLGLKYGQRKDHACQALAKRILRHEEELFQFVLVEGLMADNNLAERSIRPLVVIRKISGGTRGQEGTKTRMALASLLGTWQVRHLNPFAECLKLLTQDLVPQAETPQP